ncbi:toxin-antitoxin system YwqK family antitoxin [Cytophaga aurantiaca]|uniref:toxin-antitoxin system YwqK family antitoxin n=1 Tax=Cytophaga aurantiaca TaxID=29530 RepID=UPI000371CD1B|nr:toxin-antitoxin system YwqK family antitoxin [Cytophaga aurantiaca]
MYYKILIYSLSCILISACNNDGKRIEYYDNGNIRHIRFFKNGKLDSLFQNFDSTGKLTLELHYKNGLLNGYDRTYKNGRLKSESYFVNDNEHGMVRSWYENGQLQCNDYRIDGYGQGIEIHYYKNGNIFSEGQNKNDARTGLWKFYYENGILEKEGIYQDGHESGVWKFYNNAGQLISEKNIH